MTPPIASIERKILTRVFRTPLRTATGGHPVRKSLVVRVTLADGRVGFSEYAPMFSADAEAKVRRLNDEVRNAAETFLQNSLASHISNPSPHFLIRAALDWATRSWGAAGAPRPTAALLRDDADAESLAAAGYTTLKRKIGVAPLRDEQRSVAELVKRLGPAVTLRLDANGALSEKDTARWCDFLSEFFEIEWLEQPMRPGAETTMLAVAERAGVADRIALDESIVTPDTLPADWPGILAVKPAWLTDFETWRSARTAYPHLAYASAFESPFGRQAALHLADEHPGASVRALGFGTLGAFADSLDLHPAGPLAAPVAADWDALWHRLG